MFDAPDLSTMLIAKFERRTPLYDPARKALAGLPFQVETYPAHAYLVREGEKVKTAKLIFDGFAYRHKVTVHGGRQIVSLHIPSDFIDLEGCLLNVADHNVQALTACTVAEIPRDALISLIDEHGPLAHAMWIDTLIDASVYREWVVNVGRRTSRQAICHLLCEFGRRLEHAGLAKRGHYELPLTQEQMADSLGITPVHVNRVIRELDGEGLIKRSGRSVAVPDLAELTRVAGFNELYLHLDLLAPR